MQNVKIYICLHALWQFKYLFMKMTYFFFIYMLSHTHIHPHIDYVYNCILWLQFSEIQQKISEFKNNNIRNHYMQMYIYWLLSKYTTALAFDAKGAIFKHAWNAQDSTSEIEKRNSSGNNDTPYLLPLQVWRMTLLPIRINSICTRFSESSRFWYHDIDYDIPYNGISQCLIENSINQRQWYIEIIFLSLEMSRFWNIPLFV